VIAGRGNFLSGPAACTAKALAWLGLTGGFILLAGRPERHTDNPDRLFARAWIGLLALSLLWGWLSIAVFGAVLRASGGVSRPLWAAAAVLAALCLAGPFRPAALDLAGLLGLRTRAARTVIFLLLWAAWTACLAYLRLKQHHGHADEEQALLPALAWIRPDLEAFRVLLLVPLWGAWGMMIAVQFCRPGEGSCPALRCFAAGCGPMLSAAVMGILLWWSILYFSFLPWRQLTISAAAVLAGILSAILARRRAADLSRPVLTAANLGAQLAFLLAYLANVAR
jgi:hypothetical protein